MWSSSYAAYDRLSPELKKRLEGLEVVHSGKEQAAGAAAQGRTVRREDIEYTHPIIRTHPVTGWKALFVQPGFARRIVGVNRHESDALLKLLFDHIAGGYDFHVCESPICVLNQELISFFFYFRYDSSGQ